MKRPIILLTAVVVILLIVVLAGCGGSLPTPTPTPTPVQPNPVVSPSVSVAIVKSPGHLGASETYTFTATVSNATDTAVTWSISSSCTAGCGTISDTGLYTAPSFIPSVRVLYIMATSRADTSKSASAQLVLRPVSVSVAPDVPGSVLPGGTRSFTAKLDHDPKNAGVTWTLSGADCSGEGCGMLSNITNTTVVYHSPVAEPLPQLLMLAATSVTDPAQKASVTFSVSASSIVLQGKYAFLINGFGAQGLEAIAGQFTVDGTNVSGVRDVNRGAMGIDTQPIFGSYSIQADGRGTMTIQAGGDTFSYIVSMNSARTAARLIETTVALNENRGSSGYMVRQDANWFSLASVQGERVMAVYGEATGSHVTALGRFAATLQGTINNGVLDLSWAVNANVAQFPNTLVPTGAFSAPDANTGRGTAAFNIPGNPATTYHFAYYVVSDEQMIVVQTDARGFYSSVLMPTLSGEVRRQAGAASFTNAYLNAPFVFHLTNADQFEFGVDTPMVRIGNMVPNASGMLTTTLDQNVGNSVEFAGPLITLNATYPGTYSVSDNGRVTWKIEPGPKGGYYGTADTVAYLRAENTGYFMTPDADGAAFGTFEPQTGMPLSGGVLAGSYRINTGPPTMADVQNDSGWMKLDSSGNGTATLYVNTGSGASPQILIVTATIASNGRGTLTLDTIPSSKARNAVFWAISPDHWVAILTVNADDQWPTLLHIERDGS